MHNKNIFIVEKHIKMLLEETSVVSVQVFFVFYDRVEKVPSCNSSIKSRLGKPRYILTKIDLQILP